MSSAAPLSVLLIDADAALAESLRAAGLAVERSADWRAAARHAAVLARAPLPDDATVTQAAFDSALVVLSPDDSLDTQLALLRRGAEAVLPGGDIATLVRTLQHAAERKQRERAARTAYATDLATGLPHQAQLVEHMTQLLALREREPAPMVLLVMRVQGFEQAASKLGTEAGNVLRRKVAVRLRGLLRASDVVASISPDAFGVLLGHLEAKGDGERVASKLVRALQQSLQVAGQPCALAASVGLALYPDHGKDAQALLQRASAQAGSVATAGAAGFAALTQRVSGGAAANDDAR